MILSEIMDKQPGKYFEEDPILECELIAYDGKDGKILFDTSKNKKDYIEKYKSGKIISLWADAKIVKGYGFCGVLYKPVIKCYISHDSWKKGDGE